MLAQGGESHPAYSIRIQVNRLPGDLTGQMAAHTGDLAAQQHVGPAIRVQALNPLAKTVVFSLPVSHPGAQIGQALVDVHIQVQSPDLERMAWGFSARSSEHLLQSFEQTCSRIVIRRHCGAIAWAVSSSWATSSSWRWAWVEDAWTSPPSFSQLLYFAPNELLLCLALGDQFPGFQEVDQPGMRTGYRCWLCWRARSLARFSSHKLTGS